MSAAARRLPAVVPSTATTHPSIPSSSSIARPARCLRTSARASWSTPHGIAVDMQGSVWIADFAEARSSFNSPDELLEVNIHASRAAIKIMADGPDKWRPQTHETADHSIPYSAGLALMYGK